ncbi:MAG: alanine racemase [Chloroflexia bacterium]|nr:alanine racemase [Chloroflexia bacterium]
MIHLHDLLEASGGRLHGPAQARHFSDFCHDTRQLNPEELFVAVSTPWGDGHDYIEAAIHGGAGGILCQQPPRHPPAEITTIVVADVRQALVDWARHILRSYQPEIIAVTGSVGKTSTKEAIANVLAPHHNTFRSAGNRNDLFGLPLALGQLQPQQRYAVLEMACDRFGEIGALAAMAPPHMAVITWVKEAHLEYMESLEAIAREKGDLVAALPADGWAVLNADDPLVLAMGRRANAQLRTFGQDRRADVRFELLGLDWEGIDLRLQVGERSQDLRLPLLGWPAGYIAAAAAAVGLVCGLELPQIAAALERMPPLRGRLRPLPGVQGSRLLDDSYSIIPASALAALDTLAALPAARRIAVVGDMDGLGRFARKGAAQVGRRAARVLDRLVTCGDRAAQIAEAARQAGLAEVQVTYTIEDAAAWARRDLGPGDALLFKGGPQTRLERAVERLLADPADAPELLVRQAPPWRRRRQRPSLERPTWVELDLEAIAHNCERLAQLAAPAEVMVVIKADAYGHGAVRIAHTVLAHGAKRLGVACLSEAVALRQAGIQAPILVLGYLPPWQARPALLHNVACAVFSEDMAQALSNAAQDLRTTAALHLKVDTGMGRLGLFPQQVRPFLQRVGELPGLFWQGLFTHLSAADDPEQDPYTHRQLDEFEELLEQLEAAGYRFPLVHAANTAGLLRFPRACFNLVRPGISLYGLAPSEQNSLPEGFRSALQFKTVVAQVKTFPPGSSISYGRTYRTPEEQRIAVLPVGYADGFRRAPRHWGQVLVRGRRAPIVGRVCMDYTMVNVSHIPDVRPGDEVVLIGRQGEDEITAEEVARQLGTINYEVVSQLLARVPRLI